MVLESFAGLAPDVRRHAPPTFFDQPWIDARPRPGKPSGPIRTRSTADRLPLRVHELHGRAARRADPGPRAGPRRAPDPVPRRSARLLADTPLTLAETASIFGEGLVFERLLAEADPQERRALLAGKIEDGLNTVVRQIAFHRFETRFHAARLHGELSSEQIGGLWLEVQAESLGPAT